MHDLRLQTGPLRFAGVDCDKQSRSFVLVWRAETESRNHVFVKAVGFGLAWPPVRWLSAFLQVD